MFHIKRNSPYGTESKVIYLVLDYPGRHLLRAWIEWRPRREVWDAFVADPNVRPIVRQRMEATAHARTPSLLDAAAFAASILANPDRLRSGEWRQF